MREEGRKGEGERSLRERERERGVGVEAGRDIILYFSKERLRLDERLKDKALQRTTCSRKL